jgi:hypothetical protein
MKHQCLLSIGLSLFMVTHAFANELPCRALLGNYSWSGSGTEGSKPVTIRSMGFNSTLTQLTMVESIDHYHPLKIPVTVNCLAENSFQLFSVIKDKKTHHILYQLKLTGKIYQKKSGGYSLSMHGTQQAYPNQAVTTHFNVHS